MQPFLHQFLMDTGKSKRSLNIGNAIKTLSKDIPRFFDATSQTDFSIYSQNILFSDGTHGVSLQGLQKYRLMLSVARKVANLFYSDCCLSITSMQMSEEHGFIVRWRFQGTRRLKFWREPSNPDGKKTMEGQSFYFFNEEGFVREHVVDSIIPPIQKLNTLKAWFWWISRLPTEALPSAT